MRRLQLFRALVTSTQIYLTGDTTGCTEVEYVGFGDFSTTLWASGRDSGGYFIRDDNKQKVKFSSKNLNYLRQPKSSQFIEGKNLSWLI